MYTIKLSQKELQKNSASANQKLKKLNYLLRVQQKNFMLAILTLKVA